MSKTQGHAATVFDRLKPCTLLVKGRAMTVCDLLLVMRSLRSALVAQLDLRDVELDVAVVGAFSDESTWRLAVRVSGGGRQATAYSVVHTHPGLVDGPVPDPAPAFPWVVRELLTAAERALELHSGRAEPVSGSESCVST